MSALSSPTFGALLRQHRLAAGLTQEELAERAGLSPRAVIALELGERRKPYRHTLSLLTAALQLSPREVEMLLRAAGYAPVTRDRRRDDTFIPAAPLVGREGELAALERYLANPDPPVLMVAGEPGIGKSRLLQEAAQQAMAQGYAVLQGGGQRRSGQEPYAPLLETLARSLKTVPPARLRTALAGCSWLTRLLPELVEIASVPLPAGTLPPEQERRLVFAAVARYLSNLAGPAGTLLILDDLQWASPDGLDLLASLVHGESGRSMRVLAAYRDTEAAENPPLLALLSDLAEHELVDRIELGPLSDRDAMALLDSLLQGQDEDAPMKQRIVQRAGGVPFFLVSCVHGLEVDNRGEGVPWTVAQSIQRRVAALPREAQDVLQAAAVLGRVSRQSTLLHMLSAPEDDVVRGLDAACRARLLLAQDRSTYRFAHDVVREAIEADLGNAERMLLHRNAAEALEAQPEQGPGGTGRAAELVWHFQEGDRPERALPYAIQAGDEAAALFAHEEAERHYRTALALAGEAKNESREAEVLEKLGNLLWSTGRYEESLSMLQRAADIYEIASNLDAVGRVGAKIGWTHSHRGAPDEGIAHLEPLAARLAAMGPTAGLVDVYDALFHLYLRQGRTGEMAPAARHAAAAAQALGDESLVVRGELNRGLALYCDGRPEEALQILIPLLPRAEAVHDAVTLCRVLMWTVNSCVEAGDLDRGREYAQKTVEVTERIGSPTFLAAALLGRSQLLFLLGEWGEAHACAERALEVSAAASSWAGDAHEMLAELALAAGRWDELATHLERGSDVSTRTGAQEVNLDIEVVLAEKELMTGLPAAALGRLEALEQQHPERRHLQLVLAEARLETGDVPRAAQMVTDAETRARAGHLRLSLVEWLRLKGKLFARSGQLSGGLDAFEEALELARQMPHPYCEGRILYEMGGIHAAQGDFEQARARLEEALSLFQRLGARPYVEQTQQALIVMPYPLR